MMAGDVFVRECVILLTHWKRRGESLSLPHFSECQPGNSAALTWILHKSDPQDFQFKESLDRVSLSLSIMSVSVWTLVLITVPYPLRKRKTSAINIK